MPKKMVEKPESLNILYLSSSSLMGGAEVSLYQLIKAIDKTKYKPIVLCPRSGPLVEEFKTTNIPTIITPLFPWRKLRYRFFRGTASHLAINYAKLKNVQIVHSNSIWVNPYAQKIGEDLKIPVICHLRDLVTKNHIKKYHLDKVDMIIPVSNSVKKIVEKADIDDKKVRMIYNGIDISLFDCGKDVLRREFSIKGDIVGIISQLQSYHKGHRDFIMAAWEVSQQRPNTYFAIIGGADPSGHYISELENLTHKLGIWDKVIFTGFRSDIANIMKSLDILVSASWKEAFGRSLIEAMAAGKPVIATNVGGMPEIVQDGVTGMIVPPKAPKAIANAILRMLKDKDLMVNMGIAGQKRVKELFSLERNIKQIQEVYEEIRR